jgi:RNA polymerase sigma-70 factor (ECF subfamily)
VNDSSSGPALDPPLASRLFERAKAARWSLDERRFAEALEVSLDRAFQEGQPPLREAARYLESLHLEDLALACACADGRPQAWDHFVLQYRPALYRAADALDPSGGARDLADSLYADLYGLQEREGERQSLFRYFHGRSSLATWLRAVLAQRHVDRIRSGRRLESLPDEDVTRAVVQAPDPDRDRYLSLIADALTRAVARLSDRDRLRLALYYAQQLTLAQVGRVLGEHEATVSRQLSRARATLRKDVEDQLRAGAGLGAEELARCFASVSEDAGPLDLGWLFGTPACKPPDPERSI